MTDEEIGQLINDWYGRGIISPVDQSRLKERYLSDLGASTCTSCPSWKQDMLQHFRIYLRQKSIPVMSPNFKYIVNTESGTLNVPGQSLVVVNGTAGPATEGTDPLTDELAEGLLKKFPEFKELIVKNPEYKADEPKGDAKKVREDGVDPQASTSGTTPTSRSRSRAKATPAPAPVASAAEPTEADKETSAQPTQADAQAVDEVPADAPVVDTK